MCGKLFLNPMLHPGPQRQWSQKFLKTTVQRPPPCLDKAVLAQGGGGGYFAGGYAATAQRRMGDPIRLVLEYLLCFLSVYLLRP